MYSFFFNKFYVLEIISQFAFILVLKSLLLAIKDF